MAELLPISTLIPTRHRSIALAKTFESLGQQCAQPAEIIVVDASDDGETEAVCARNFEGLDSKIRYYKAETRGAASQRNEAFHYAECAFIHLVDDDVFFDPECMRLLYETLTSDDKLGGVNAMIINQQYSPPGPLTSRLYPFLLGQKRETYAGLCIGPVVNLLPEDRDELPDVNPVEWMNSTCVLYRKEALPNPPFPKHFKGYSLMEDVTLSLTVAKEWAIANVRIARIFHDSQPGDHKSQHSVLAEMEIVNRHFVMTRILKRTTEADFRKMIIYELYRTAIYLKGPSTWPYLLPTLWGKAKGVLKILAHG